MRPPRIWKCMILTTLLFACAENTDTREEDHNSDRPTKARAYNKKGLITTVLFCNSVCRDSPLAFSPYTGKNDARGGIRKQGRVIARPLQRVTTCSTYPLLPTTSVPHLASISASHPVRYSFVASDVGGCPQLRQPCHRFVASPPTAVATPPKTFYGCRRCAAPTTYTP
jgi:hypothetical protein